MIAGKGILAREDDVAMRGGIGGARPLRVLLPDERPRNRDRACHVEPPAMRLLRQSLFALGRAEVAAGAGIERRAVRRCAVRRREAGGNIGAGAEAGVDEPAGTKTGKRGGVIAQMLRLANRRAVESQAQPLEIGERSADKRLARAAAVDVVDAEVERPARGARGIMRQDRAERVAKVQFAGRAGGEAGQHGVAAESICCGALNPSIPYIATHPP